MNAQPSPRCVSYLLALSCVSLLTPACKERGVEIHDVAKGVEAAPPVADATATPMPEAAGSTQTVDDLPEGWALDPTPRPMRVSTYLVEDPDGPVEVAVTRFPGDTGGVLANINRWRQQVGLGPVTEAELPGMIRSFAGGRGYAVEIENGERTLLGAGVFDPASGQTWFLKATTSPVSAARVRTGFDRMAESLAAAPASGGSAAP